MTTTCPSWPGVWNWRTECAKKDQNVASLDEDESFCEVRRKYDRIPFPSKYFKISSCAICAASCNGLFMSLLVTSTLNASMLNPSHRYLTMFIFPSRAATCNAVSPDVT
ncbi:hypothetical protein ALC60_05158 [Trachymyrmex zeteki]|uniref:Uncharacterized protein n=1 Tax=Mycetomoellerius zeteki TaxID=64791 RepID=A0A151X663_9HYME|nr:hypothetical protein ALC60_05158 [Trachymyrmex zeteki]